MSTSPTSGAARPPASPHGTKPTRTRTRRASAAVGALAIVVLPAVALPGAARADAHRRSATGTLWVTNQGESPGTVFAVDAGTGERLASITVGSKPIGVVAAPGNGHVYVSNEGDDTVSVIDKVTLTVVDTIDTGWKSKPHHMAISPNGRVVYVAEFGANTVSAIDTRTNEVTSLKASDDSSARTHAVWVSSNGTTLYAANSGVNTVGVIDVRTGDVAEIGVGENPSEVLVTRDGKTAYVSVRDQHQVEVIDLATGVVIDAVYVGPQPDTLQLTNHGRTLVVALRGTPAQVALVDTADLSVGLVKISRRDGTGYHTTTGHHWLSADGKYTFLAVEGPAGVAVVDNEARMVVDVYQLPQGAKPHGLFYEPRPLT